MLPQTPNRVVPFNPSTDKLVWLDFTAANKELTAAIINHTDRFSTYLKNKLERSGALYGIGGYDEHRTIYSRSKVFDTGEEPRRLHLGIDIWGKAGTPVFALQDGTVHSFAFNDAYGDYGATIILQHRSGSNVFHTLYGHLSLADLNGLEEGKPIQAGETIAHFGEPQENGHWPPHLHFQIINDMEERKGDYPGVCKFSEREMYLANCPDPDQWLHLLAYAGT